jgi:hypothetical protein
VIAKLLELTGALLIGTGTVLAFSALARLFLMLAQEARRRLPGRNRDGNSDPESRGEDHAG